jgi:hypothetical protein
MKDVRTGLGVMENGTDPAIVFLLPIAFEDRASFPPPQQALLELMFSHEREGTEEAKGQDE